MESVISFQVRGLEYVQSLLGRDIDEVLRPGLRNAALMIERKMKMPPRAIPGVLAQRGTRAQQRAFFAKMRENGGTWARTGQLEESWTWEFTKAVRGVHGARVYNPTEYAHWVQARKFQARMHQGIWQTDQEVLNESKPQIVSYVTEALRRGFA